MENLVHLELSDKTKVSIYPAQRVVVFGDAILKFEEVKQIYKAIKSCVPGKRPGRSPRKMPSGFKYLCESGLSYDALCRVYNCSKTTVCRWKRELTQNEK